MKRCFLFLVLLFSVSCGENHLVLQRQKKVVPTTPTATEATVTYVKDIKPLFDRTCSACHNEGSAIPNWGLYEVSFAKKDRLLDRIVTRKDMPLGFPMSDSERTLVSEWIRLGAPEGLASVVITEPPQSQPPTPPDTQPPASPVEPAPTKPEPVLFAQVKVRVFDQYCALCHNENSGDMMPNWANYDIARSKKDRLFVRVVQEQSMPPVGMPMTDTARDLLKQWIDGGALE